MKHTVCILAAGQGTRMGRYGKCLNKALLPLGKKGVISHIIERFPAESQFVVALGHKGHQIRDYLLMAHPAHSFTFVEVDNFCGKGSGPGYSLLSCKAHIAGPFYFVTCDTLWNTPIDFTLQRDWFGVSRVPESVSASYCNFEVEDGRIVAIRDKESVCGESFWAFVGLGYVRNHELFWRGLGSRSEIAGEIQNSNGLKELVKYAAPQAIPLDWVDVGSELLYEKALTNYDGLDWSKSNEAIYIVNGHVIKYFNDEHIVAKRLTRAAQRSGIFPQIKKASRNFYCYEFAAGRTLYDRCSPAIFSKLLFWLEQEVWIPIQADSKSTRFLCQTFYKAKTLERLQQYSNLYGHFEDSLQVNGETVPAPGYLLDLTPWDDLCRCKPVFFHGDLNFDNIIYSEEYDRFLLLDWRQDFGGELSFGDLYYDLAKLYAGLILNYSYIRGRLFGYVECESGVWLDCPQSVHAHRYIDILKDFVEERGLSWSKVRILAAITFLNMAPLHTEQFAKFLYHFGRSLLWRELKCFSTGLLRQDIADRP